MPAARNAVDLARNETRPPEVPMRASLRPVISVLAALAVGGCEWGATDFGSGGTGGAAADAGGGSGGAAGRAGSGGGGSPPGSGGAPTVDAGAGSGGTGAADAGGTGGVAGSDGGAGGTPGGSGGSGSGGARGTGGATDTGGGGGRGTGGVAGTGGRGGAGTGGATGTGGGGGTGGAAAFRPCPTNGDPCRILPLGDSITDGYNVPGGYRIELFRRALGASKRITFTGAQMNGPMTVDGTTFPRSHEGHSGWRIDEIANLVPTPALQTTPHIVLLMAGTNDVIQNNNLGAAPQRLGALLDEIFTGAPQALVVVALLTPLQAPTEASRVLTFNAAVPAIVQTRAAAGRHVVLVDMYTGFPISELADGIHPNTAGYARMAGVWYAAIGSLLP
jgi:lysophospholipase L1-like esterase